MKLEQEPGLNAVSDVSGAAVVFGVSPDSSVAVPAFDHVGPSENLKTWVLSL